MVDWCVCVCVEMDLYHRDDQRIHATIGSCRLDNIDDCDLLLLLLSVVSKGQNPLHQFPRSKFTTSPQHKGQVKSVTSS